MTKPYKSPAGHHRHRCSDPACGTVWEHKNRLWFCSTDRAAHMCPKCGAESEHDDEQFLKYTGPEKPNAEAQQAGSHAAPV